MTEKELDDLLSRIGRAEWRATKPQSALGHAWNTFVSVLRTKKHFKLRGKQEMHFVSVEGVDVVVCLVGTSPNSPDIARVLTGLWNHLHDEKEKTQ